MGVFPAGAPVLHEEEKQYILQAQAGDRQAFGVLVEHYWTPLYRWLHGQVRSVPLVEDLVQEAFLKAWEKRATFQAGTHFRAWLFRIASNCLIDHRRCRRNFPLQAVPDTLPAREPGPVAEVLNRENQERLGVALARLPTGIRSAFLLRTQQGFSFREIAETLDLTEETARWRVFRARKLLLKELESCLEQEHHEL
jgi:RNA polymerase sigma-70 factor (ECF subfamily)